MWTWPYLFMIRLAEGLNESSSNIIRLKQEFLVRGAVLLLTDLGRRRGSVVRKMRMSGTLLLVALLQSAVVTGFNLSPFLGRLGAPRNGVSLVAVSSRPQAAARGSVAGAARVGYRLCMTKGNNENQVSVDADIVQGEEERVALWEEIEREELRMKLAAE